MSIEQNTSDPLAAMRVLTMRQLQGLIPYTPQHIYRLETAGKFPKRIRIGANRVAWRQADILKWVAERPTVEPTGRSRDEEFDDD